MGAGPSSAILPSVPPSDNCPAGFRYSSRERDRADFDHSGYPARSVPCMHRRVFLIFAAMLICGCGSIREHRGIASADPAEKIPAIKKAGITKDKHAIPLLIKELNHDDPAVRLYAS